MGIYDRILCNHTYEGFLSHAGSPRPWVSIWGSPNFGKPPYTVIRHKSAMGRIHGFIMFLYFSVAILLRVFQYIPMLFPMVSDPFEGDIIPFKKNNEQRLSWVSWVPGSGEPAPSYSSQLRWVVMRSPWRTRRPLQSTRGEEKSSTLW